MNIQVDMDSALWNAAYDGNAEEVQQLINEGANVNYDCYGGITPLHCAALCKHVQCLRILIDYGANINATSGFENETVLHYAAKGGSIECMQMLIDRGADVHAKAEHGWTALHFAAQGRNTRCIQLLYELGVDIDVKNNDGKTAYDIARQYRQHDAAELLQALSAHKANKNLHNANQDAEHHVSDPPRMELDNELEVNTHQRLDCCMQCLCKTCKEKENKLKNLEKEMVDLKQNVAAMEERMKSIEERNSGFNGLPLVVTTMVGFDSGDMLGNDYANLQVRRIFTKHNLNVFKKHLEPNVLTERQYQELQGLSADMTKAEYLWSLMRQKKMYLDAMRQALMKTKQLGSHEVLAGMLNY